MSSSFKRGKPNKSERSAKRNGATQARSDARWLRIVGGEFRSRKILYNGDPDVRPMKDRTRESVFNLTGHDLTDFLVVDLFGGTGALALEALSRGAHHAIVIELSRSATRTIMENVERLKAGDRVVVHNADTLRWLAQAPDLNTQWPDSKWLVFCSPPYQLWKDDGERLCAGLRNLLQSSPTGSLFVAESDEDFDIQDAMPELQWDVRLYKPARIAVAEKRGA